MNDETTMDESVFCAGSRVFLTYPVGGRRVRVEGTVSGRDPAGRVCVGFDDGGNGCFTAGALLNAMPPYGRAVREGRIVVVADAA